jgi:predicted DNA-binding transcriptional regulator AlpA
MRDDLKPVLAQARTVSPDELPRLLGDLEEVRATALARLAAPQPIQSQADELLDVPEASRRLGVSGDYLYRHHKDFPFTRHMGRKLLFSLRGIEKHIKLMP